MPHDDMADKHFSWRKLEPCSVEHLLCTFLDMP